MLRTQCPACKNDYDVEADDIGQTLGCDCGADLLLLAEDAALPAEIKVACPSCGEEYDVESEDAGEEMECECGSDVRVPFLVIARQAKKKLKKKSRAGAKGASSSTQAPSIVIDTESAKPQKSEGDWRDRAQEITPPGAGKSTKSKSANAKALAKQKAEQQRKAGAKEVSVARNDAVPKAPPKQSASPKQSSPKQSASSKQSVRPAKDRKSEAVRGGQAPSRSKQPRVKDSPSIQVAEQKKPQPAKGVRAAKLQATESPDASDWRGRAKSLANSKAKQSQTPSTWQPLDPAEIATAEDAVDSNDSSSSGNSRKERAERRASREKPKPVLEIVAASVVGLLLLGSIVAYVFRGAGAKQQVAQQDASGSGDAASLSAETGGTPVETLAVTGSESERAGDEDASSSESSASAEDVVQSDTRVNESAADTEGSATQAGSEMQGAASASAIMQRAGGDSFVLGGDNPLDATGDSETSESVTAEVSTTGDLEVGENEGSGSDGLAASTDPAGTSAGGSLLDFPAIKITDIRPMSHDQSKTSGAAKKQPREVVPVIESDEKYVTFERAYAIAYEAMQTYEGLKKEGSGNPARTTALGQAIGKFLVCRDVAGTKVTDEQKNQIAYMLANLYFDAGHLYTAGVLAQHLATYGPADQPTSKACAMIGVAAFQEAHQTQFADQHTPGELRQIAQLGKVIQKRWPKHPQLDLIRYSNAQAFEADGYPVDAAAEYVKVREPSDFFAKAQLAAGRLLWSLAQSKEKADTDDPQIQGIISTASRHLRRGVRAMAEQKATATFVASKFSLAQIYLRRGDSQMAAQLLGKGSNSVTSLAGKQVKMSDNFVTLAYETLFAAYSQSGDVANVQATLEVLSERYGPQGKSKITKLYTNLAGEFIAALPAGKAVTSEQIDRFESIVATILNGTSEVPLETKLWVASKWSSLAPRAGDAVVSERCTDNSNAIFGELLNDPSLDSGKRLAIQLKLIEAFEAAEQFDQAIATIEGILADKPNTIDVQFQAARLLYKQALVATSAAAYEAAIVGKDDSPVWAWQQLCKTMMKLHFASEDTEKYLDRMLDAVYHLNASRVAKARLPEARAGKAELLKAASSQLKQVNATLVTEGSVWRDKLLSLEKQVAKLMPL